MKTYQWMLICMLAWTMAGQAVPADSLGLADVVQQALEQSWQIKHDTALVVAGEKALHMTHSQYYPQVRMQGHHFQFFYQPYNYKEQGLELVLDWRPGNWFLNVGEADQRRVFARQKEAQTSRLQVASRTIDLYMALQTARLELKQLERKHWFLQQHLEMNRALWQSGVRTELDVIQTRQALEQVSEALIVQQGRVLALTRQLALQLGRPAEKPLPLRKLEPGRWIDALKKSLLPVHTRWSSGHPRLQSLKLQEAFLRLSKRKVDAGLWPSLKVGSGYVIDRDPTGSGNYGIVALQFQVPLYLWHASRLKKQQLEAQARAVGWQYRQVEQELQKRFEQLQQQQKAFTQALQVQKQEMSLARQALALARANYQSGLSTNLDFLFAQQQLFETRLRLARTRMALLQNLLETALLSGNLGILLKAGVQP